MPRIYEKRQTAQKHAVKKDDTLAAIVTKYQKDRGQDAVPDADKYYKQDISTWQELALYNWGTAEPPEVVRVLCERVGTASVVDTRKNVPKPEEVKLDPARGTANGDNSVLVPKIWKKANLALNKLHTIKVTRRFAPPAVSIVRLSNWFIPETEKCDIVYSLEGPKERADKLHLNIWASNYCKAKETAIGPENEFYSYTFEPVDESIFDDEKLAAEERKTGVIYDKWSGQTTAKNGTLKAPPKPSGLNPPPAKQKYINVAHSPYSVQLRYFKKDADKQARLVLKPFWPVWKETVTSQKPTGAKLVEADDKVTVKWDNADKVDRGFLIITDKTGQVVYSTAVPLDKGAQQVEWDKKYTSGAWNSDLGNAFLAADGPYVYDVNTIKFELNRSVQPGNVDPMKIQWLVKGIDKLDGGQVLIYDGADKLVFQAGLPKDKFKKSTSDTDFRDFTWDGKYASEIKNSDNGDVAIPKDMPYRVQLQAHTGPDEEDGVALAIMQTEVRLAVHPKIGTNGKLPIRDPQCFEFELAPLLPSDDLAKKDGKDDEKIRWAKMKLAKAGFHPGPVDKRIPADDKDPYKIALKEFQRSVPVDKGGGADPRYERLVAKGELDAKGDIKDAKSKTVLDKLAENHRAMFADPGSNRADMTDVDAINTRLNDTAGDIVVWVEDRHYYTKATVGDLPDAKMQMEDYGDDMDIDDAKRIAVEEKSVARPWIPVEISLPLLSKDDALTDEPASLDVTDQMRRALGPLRVDWTFREPGEDLSPLATLRSHYNEDGCNWTRSWRFVQEIVKDNSVLYKTVKYANCPQKLGGLRPGDPPSNNASMNTYYKAMFGADANSLLPWRAVADATTETVCTLIHDDLAVDKQHFYEKSQGKTGVFFNPSRIAGDGYRFRAQVSFAKHPTADWNHPNREVLAARYPQLPQAHTCAMRLWRKASFRTYTEWGSGGLAGSNIASLPASFSSLTSVASTFYPGAFLHWVFEDGSNGAGTVSLTTLLDGTKPADVTAYQNVLDTRIANRANYPAKNKMTIKANNFWPWIDEKNYGMPWNKQNPPLTTATFESWITGTVKDDTIEKIDAALMYLLIHQVEARLGLLCGHVLVPWCAVPDLWKRVYVCNAAGAHRVVVPERSQAAAEATGAACPVAGCAGTLQKLYIKYYKCTTDNRTWFAYEKVQGVDNWVGDDCPDGHVGTTILDPTPQVPPHRSEVNFKSSTGPGLGASAVGEPMGGLWLYLNVEVGLQRTTAHEVGHHRHLSHPYAVHVGKSWANPYKKWHDIAVNNNGMIPGSDSALWKDRWDRRCTMSYFVHPVSANNAGYDTHRFFCGKCLFKFRGWKVENLSVDGGKFDPAWKISGNITQAGSGVANVVMHVTPGTGIVSTTPKTAVDGSYSVPDLPAGVSYTVTPKLAGKAFTPANQVINNLSADQTADFTASSLWTISGRITQGGTGVHNVVVTLSPGGGTATTAADGTYSIPDLAAGANYTATPTLMGKAFTPANKVFNNLAADQTADFTAT